MSAKKDENRFTIKNRGIVCQVKKNHTNNINHVTSDKTKQFLFTNNKQDKFPKLKLFL